MPAEIQLYASATSCPKLGFFSAWSFKATPPARRVSRIRHYALDASIPSA
jgi:hypothetical protein